MRLRAFLLAILTVRAWAGACCGGAGTLPTLMLGDESARLGMSATYSGVVGDAPASGLSIFRDGSDHESAQTLRLEGAFLLSDRWQAGATLPITRRARNNSSLDASATGLGELAVALSYEALPDWDYNPLRPRIHVFAQGDLPLGRSIYQAREAMALDATSRPHARVGFGSVLSKAWEGWDALLMAALTRDVSFGHAAPLGWNVALSMGAGFSPLPDWRLGLVIAPQWEQGNGRHVWDASLALSWMLSDSLGLSATYADQTLLGSPSNSTLARSFALRLEQRWLR